MKREGNVSRGGAKPVCCNLCGKSLKVEGGILKEDAFEATKNWGYFSKRDLEIHHFNLCEACYDNLINSFKIPVEVEKQLEVL